MEKLILVADDGNSLTKAFGLTEDRVKELGTEMEIIFRKKAKEGEPKIKTSDKLNEIVELAGNMNELVWAVFNFGYNIGNINQVKIMNVGSVAELSKVLGGKKEEK